jgi:hypothetical protein
MLFHPSCSSAILRFSKIRWSMEVGLSKGKLINNQGTLLNAIYLVGYGFVDSQIYFRNLTRIKLSIYTEVKRIFSMSGHCTG